jgi:hypothetical protein
LDFLSLLSVSLPFCPQLFFHFKFLIKGTPYNTDELMQGREREKARKGQRRKIVPSSKFQSVVHHFLSLSLSVSLSISLSLSDLVMTEPTVQRDPSLKRRAQRNVKQREREREREVREKRRKLKNRNSKSPRGQFLDFS